MSSKKTYIQMANKNMKRCSTLLIIRELRIKTTMSYHLTWIKMVIIKKNLQTESRRGCEEKGILFHCWWESKLIQPLWRTVWRFLKKLGIKLPYDPVNLLLGIYPEKTITEKDTCTPMFIAALFTTALEEEMATHSSILAWRIPWTGEPGSPWGHKELDTT